MAKIIQYLDCGCCITDEGRTWCPSCLAPKPITYTQTELDDAVTAAVKARDKEILNELTMVLAGSLTASAQIRAVKNYTDALEARIKDGEAKQD